MTSLTTRGLRPALLSFFTSALADFERHAHAFSLVCTVPDASPTLPAPAPRVRTPAERLIILDSSFNPPTVAHMRMVLSAVESYYDPSASATTEVKPGGPARGSARILLLLSVNNADKAPRPASFPQRLAMMYLFAKELRRRLPRGPEVDVGLAAQPYFHSKCELIAGAEGGYAGAGAMEQVFLVGYDTLIRVFNPKYYGEGGSSMEEVLGPFFGKARLRVALRTGDGWGGEGEQRGYLRELGEGGLERVGGRGEWVERVELVEGEGEVVSSTLVREAVRGGDEVALGRLLGEEVREWVLAEGLYRDE